MKFDWKDILERAAWTFMEGFLVALFATFNAGMDAAALKSALLGAAMAGVSALKTVVLDFVRKNKIVAEEEITE